MVYFLDSLWIQMCIFLIVVVKYFLNYELKVCPKILSKHKKGLNFVQSIHVATN